MISEYEDDESWRFKKPLDTLVMIPRSRKMSPLTRKMFNVLLHISQKTLANMDGIPPANFLFTEKLSEILTICKAESQNSKAKQYLTEMRKTEVVWDSPESTSELQHVGFNLLSEVRITKSKDGLTWVSWALPPSLYDLLASPNRWATIDLLMLSHLRSYAAIVLYEICSKYRDNPSKLTCRKEPSWWIELLSSTPFAVDKATGLRKMREWRKYKDEIVLNAIDEINAETDINIELIENRMSTGNHIVKTIQFKIAIKKSLVQIEKLSDLPQVSSGVIEYGNKLGISEAHSIKSMITRHGDVAVKSALRKLEDRQKQIELPHIRSPVGFTNHLLETTTAADKTNEHINVNPTSANESGPPEKIALIPRHLQLIAEQQKSVEDVHADVLKEILLLSNEEINDLLKRCSAYLKSQGRLNASLAKRLSGVDWCNGIAKYEVIKYYGVQTRGPGWNQPSEHLAI